MASAASWAALTPAQKAEIELKILDTFHDFCTKERKKKQSGEKPRAKETDDDIPESKLNTMREYIYIFLKNQYPGIFTDPLIADVDEGLKQLIRKLTPSSDPPRAAQVTGIGELENNVVSYWEKDSVKKNLINVKGIREYLTYDQILAGHTNGDNSPLWNKFKTNRDTVTILEINRGDTYFDSLELDKRNIIANFILTFFFGTAQGDMRCTFDANAGIPGKIFEDITQVKNIIFPQTIADSATTTFGAMRGRNEFIFPSEDLKPTTAITMKSAVYSDQKYRLQFVNKNFSSQSPYGFKIVLENTTAPVVKVELPFSASQTEGPSVNYLVDILEKAKKPVGAPSSVDLSGIEKKKQILSLGDYIQKNLAFKNKLVTDIRANTDGLLLDIKRSGDHEAALATQRVREKNMYKFFIFVTIDILCALESRRLGNPTMWHYGDRLILYRSSLTLSPDVQRALIKSEIIFKLNDAIKAIELMNFIESKVGRITFNSERNKVIATSGQLGEIYTNAEFALKGQVILKRDEGNPHQAACEKILMKLLRLRMIELQYQVFDINEKIGGLRPKNDFDMFDPIIKDFLKAKDTWNINEGTGVVTVTLGKGSSRRTTDLTEYLQTNIKPIMVGFDTFIQGVNELLGTDISIDSITKDIKLYNQLTTTPNTEPAIFKEVENTAMNYSTLPFFSFYRSLYDITKAAQLAYNAEGGLGKRTFLNYLNGTFKEGGALKTLHKSAKEILEQFVNRDQFEGNEPTYISTYTELKNLLLFKPFADATRPFSAAAAASAAASSGASNDFYIVTKDKSEIYTLSFPPINEFYDYYGVAADASLTLYTASGGGKQQIQRGGATVYQYYDLATLLLELGSKAAAFIESAYAEFYPAVALDAAIEQAISVKRAYELRLSKPRKYPYYADSAEVITVFNNTINQANYLLDNQLGDYIFQEGKKANILRYLVDCQIAVNQAEARWEVGNYIEAVANINSAIEQLNLFRRDFLEPCSCLDKSPSFKNFFEYINNREDLQETAHEILNDLQTLWEDQFQQIVTNEAYEWDPPPNIEGRSLSTNMLITFLLSLRSPYSIYTTNESILFDYFFNESNREARETYIRYLQAAHRNTDIPILFIFTLLENKQNHRKFVSFFYGNREKKRYYTTKGQWQGLLWEQIHSLIRILGTKGISNKQSVRLQIDPPAERIGRGGKRYPKKTRRQAKRTKSKRKTRRHR